MPTENRSTMLSVPRELTPEMREAFHSSYDAYEDGRGECPDSQWRAMLRAAPKSAQHQGEPVALPDAMHPHDFDNLPESHCNGWNACLDEIAKLGPLYTHPAPVGEQEPFAWFVESPQECEHVEGVARTREDANKYAAAGWSITPIFRHADPGEVERLREALATVKADRDAYAQNALDLRAQLGTETARADAAVGDANEAERKLAERDVLLRDFCAHSALICGDLLRLAREDDFATTDPIRTRAYSAMDHARKVKKTLSASAEPASTARRCEPCRVEMADQRPCDLCSAEPTAREARALQEEKRLGIERLPVERDVVQHNADRYVAIELAGVMGEYMADPCGSTEARMRDTLCRYDNRIKAMIKAHQGIPEIAEPSASKCKACGQTPNLQGGEYPCQACGLPTVHDDQSAPVKRDERAMTKAFHDWAFYKKGEAIGRMDGQQAALEGFIAGADWQARAALERKPSCWRCNQPL
ncbi:TPA: hypothetical protein SMR42_000366 [Pseudomonas putida]|nr:hypothetical protein [Pseudomonas putida]